VLLFSGFVKGIDPLGSNYKFIDYFTAFGMDFLNPAALPLGVLLSTFEFVLGAVLIFHVKPRTSSRILLVFMGFFTLLTFYLALENPVQDCGCFGNAIIMSNWETFWKNVVIMVFVVIIFINRNNFQSPYSNKWQWGITGISAGIILGLSVYCYNHLPVFDFRPYNVGANIPDKMEIPEDAPQPEYKTILKYKKDGKIKEFTMDSLPDSTWQWVETKNIKIKEGYQPPIEDFTISTLKGEDITDIVLNQNKFTFLLIAYDLGEADKSEMDKINKLAEFCNTTNNCSFIGLTASLEEKIESFKNNTNASFSFYQADEITLKTIIRANPGLMLIKKGIILDKWHNNDLPSPQEIREDFLNNSEYKDTTDTESEDKKGRAEVRS
ncbi:MAG: DoxX family protein, partial [Bacteroidales bacterium]|nr:DoxX family protein [Bacteroidales bacterium]